MLFRNRNSTDATIKTLPRPPSGRGKPEDKGDSMTTKPSKGKNIMLYSIILYNLMNSFYYIILNYIIK